MSGLPGKVYSKEGPSSNSLGVGIPLSPFVPLRGFRMSDFGFRVYRGRSQAFAAQRNHPKSDIRNPKSSWTTCLSLIAVCDKLSPAARPSISDKPCSCLGPKRRRHVAAGMHYGAHRVDESKT